MAFGVKIRNVETNGSYTIDSFFDAIKERSFTAGVPSLIRRGAASVIVFPALDNQNQVWIVKAGLRKESRKFSVQKGEAADLGGIATASVADTLTGGLFGFGSMMGRNTKKCEELVVMTAKELMEMGL